MAEAGLGARLKSMGLVRLAVATGFSHSLRDSSTSAIFTSSRRMPLSTASDSGIVSPFSAAWDRFYETVLAEIYG
jgi:hypothetical protein